MSDEMKFDFAKAKSLSNTVNECKRCIDDANGALKRELDSVGLWWIGQSYNRFKSSFDDSGGVKSILDGLSAETTRAGNYLVKIIDSKKDYEKNTTKYLR